MFKQPGLFEQLKTKKRQYFYSVFSYGFIPIPFRLKPRRPGR
ncbi:hypothetical protein NEILACOT_03631 [Neisseria lactamica ATCC 23970]|uniref:Uncharacterized protein n=1 Tax=Neisseria lactamica ATCC 23970 TaxID=546265 RepID=D0W7Y0_NEILA|nr:hypothetical protein NEILACOT_03631 [Neisseria lactamica ATCC 23970]